MGKIKLSGGFTIIPEGNHIFKVTSVEYKEAFGKLTINMETEDGSRHSERYTFIRDNGGTNDGAVRAFSYFARTVTGNYSADEIDPEDLVGGYIECEVTHDVQPNKNKPGETVTFLRLKIVGHADGFGGESEAPAPPPAPKTPMSLDDILS